MTNLLLVIFVYVTIFISFVCSLYVAFKLYKNKINYLVGILSAATALIELVVLSSAIWIEDFEHKVPKKYCIFQGIAIQYFAYLQIISALCFSIHLYQLLVRKMERNSHTLHRIYMFFIIVVPILMTIIVAIVSIQNEAIQPFNMSCDIKNPMWVRLIGYPGFNLITTIIGSYFSIRAVFKVFRHLDQFKSQMTDRISNNVMTNNSTTTNGDVESANVTNESNETRAKTDFLRNVQRSYSLTKAAAMRMVLFSLGFTLVNILASIQTILQLRKAIKGEKDQTTGLRSADFAVACTGIFIYVIFGLPNIFKKRT